jgi:hypothetical protein
VSLVFGKEEDIYQVIVDLNSKGFSLKVERDLKEYFSCRVIETSKNKKIHSPTPLNQQIDR